MKSLRTAISVTSLLCYWVASTGVAAPKAPDFQLSATINPGKLLLRALPPAGHHINRKAPGSVTSGAALAGIKPTRISENEALFELASTEDQQLSVTLYLCDDKNTYCEKHRQEVNWKKDGSLLTPKPVGARPTGSQISEATPEKSVRVNLKPDTEGFILNAPDKAFELAAAQKKPVMIDFFGIWCPPCNMLDERVFSSLEFRKATAKFIKLKLDVDSPVSWPLKSRYKVGGYPTLVFTASDGDEIRRVVGFREKTVIMEEIALAFKSKDRTFNRMLVKADRGDREAADQVGLTYFERADYGSAKKYLDQSKKHRQEYLASDVADLEAHADSNLASGGESKGAKAKLIPAMEKYLAEFPDAPEAMDMRMRLAAQLKDQGQEAQSRIMILSAIKQGKELLADPKKLLHADLIEGDVLAAMADAYETLEMQDKAKDAWKQTAESYGAYSKSNAKERGYNLERAHALWKAGDVAGAEKLYASLEAAYPDEFTFYFSHARMNQELKRFAEAEPLAQKALDHAYGDNRLRVAASVAKIKKELGKNDEAKSLIKAELASTLLPDDKTIRTHRYAKALQELEKSL